MSADPENPELDMAVDPAQAFEAMRHQLALLTAAVEAFASRQSKLEERDYGPDLAALIDRQDKIREALYTLAEQPGVALTPETMAAELVEAGKNARAADHRMITEAVTAQRIATAALDTVVGTARTREQQRDALILAAVVGMMAMMMLVVAADWFGSEFTSCTCPATVAQIDAATNTPVEIWRPS